jgi:DNA-binding NarL/FixJ family response regulator
MAPPPAVAGVAGSSEGAPHVTERQREVLELLADGQSNKEIGRALDLSPATVKTHVAQLIATFGAVNRTEVAVKAQGLLRRRS